MSNPTPAIMAGKKKPSSSEPVRPSSPLTNGKGQKPRILVNHPELEEIMTRLKEDEQINKQHGWYDANKNGKKYNQREKDRAAGKLRSQRKNKKENNR